MKIIKIKLMELNKTQIELWDELRKRGFPTLTPQRLNLFINHPNYSGQCQDVLTEIDKILDEWGKERRSAK